MWLPSESVTLHLVFQILSYFRIVVLSKTVIEAFVKQLLFDIWPITFFSRLSIILVCCLNIPLVLKVYFVPFISPSEVCEKILSFSVPICCCTVYCNYIDEHRYFFSINSIHFIFNYFSSLPRGYQGFLSPLKSLMNQLLKSRCWICLIYFLL
jgi:hypothetical protein